MENFTIELEDAGKRLDVYLSRLFKDFSRGRIQELIKNQNALVNGEPSKSSYKLKHNDSLNIVVPELKPLELTVEDVPLDIRYEDGDMLVVNKPSGMLTHPTSIQKENTLVNALLYHCKDKLSGINGVMRPGILHRLDKDTSGLLMVAKNDFAHNFLAEQIKEKTAVRQYLAVVKGIIKNNKGTINAPIARHPKHRHKMGVVSGGKHAVTNFKVLERFAKHTLVEATLETGRTHQIRVHFAHIGYPLEGDGVYNSKIIKMGGQALQAYRLSFNRPSDNEKITIEIDMDEKLSKLVERLKHHE